MFKTDTVPEEEVKKMMLAHPLMYSNCCPARTLQISSTSRVVVQHFFLPMHKANHKNLPVFHKEKCSVVFTQVE